MGQIQFSATVSGGGGVSWSVNGAAGGNSTVGVINNTGLYTAPTTLPSPNTVTVTAATSTSPTQSASASVTIVNPQPTLSSISPPAVPVGSGNTQLTVTGTGFAYGSVVEVGGVALPTLYWNPTALTATVPAALLAMTASLPVLVTTPAPGGGTSSAVTLTVMIGVLATKNPQVAMYAFSTTQAASVSVEFGTDTTYGLHTWAQTTPQGGGAVQILVAGMRANTTYHMRADITYTDGTQAVDQDHTFTTGALPAARIPQISVTNPNGLTPSPGAILLDLLPGTSNQVMPAAVDNAGNLIWYYDYNSSLGLPDPIKLLPNGHMILNVIGSPPYPGGPGLVQEIDLAGNLINQFSVGELNSRLSNAGYSLAVTMFHHDLLPLSNGHLILLTNHTVNCADLPGCVGGDNVLGDALVDLDQNYNPVWVWDSFDHLCSASSTSPCLDINRRPMGWPDWTHCNAIVYSPDDGNLLLSSRHQSWVMKLDYENGQGSGEILWRLGYQGDFTLTNGQSSDWFYAQHYPNFDSSNTTGVFNLGVFDNGNDRVVDAAGDVCGIVGQPACYSTVPILQVNETAMTATLLWQYSLSPVFAMEGGSDQLLSTNDVVFDLDGPSDDPTGSRYMEVTYTPTPQVVLQMEISGQNAYRAVHMPSLYPGVQW